MKKVGRRPITYLTVTNGVICYFCKCKSSLCNHQKSFGFWGILSPLGL